MQTTATSTYQKVEEEGRKAKERKSAVIQTFHVVPASARPLTPDTLTTKGLAFVAQSVALGGASSDTRSTGE